MQGLHLTGDLSGCRCAPALLTDPAALEALCVAAVGGAGLAAVNRLFHAFAPGSGITGVVLLAESHLAVHTWPELAAVTLDVYVCNYGGDNSAKARALFESLCAAFSAADVQSRTIERGAAGPCHVFVPAVAPVVTPVVAPGVRTSTAPTMGAPAS